MIRSLELQNFRVFTSAELLLGERTLIVGHNGAGKSSISDALSYLATGACRGTDVAGRGIEQSIRFGATTMSVAADVDGIGVISRGRGARVISRGSRKGEEEFEPVSNRAEELLASRGVSRRQWELAIRPDAFFSLDLRGQGDTLCELAGVPTLTLEEVLRAGAPANVKAYADRLDGSLSGYYQAEGAARKDRIDAHRASTTAKGAWETARDECTTYDATAHAQAKLDLAAARELRKSLERAEQDGRAAHQALVSERTRKKTLADRALAACQPSSGADVAALQAKRAALEEELTAKREAAGGKSAAQLREEVSALCVTGCPTDQVTLSLHKEQVLAAEAEAKILAIQEAQEGLGEQEPKPVKPEGTAEFGYALRLLEEADANDPRCYACGASIDYEALLRQGAELTEAIGHYEAAHKRWADDDKVRRGLAAELAAIQAREHGKRIVELEEVLAKCGERDKLTPLLAAAQAVEQLELALRQLDAHITAAEADPTRKAERLRLEAEALQAATDLEDLGSYLFADAAKLQEAIAEAERLAGLVASHETAARAIAEVERLRAAWDRLAGEHAALETLVVALEGQVRQELFGGPIARLQEDLSAAMFAVGAFLDGAEPVQLYDASLDLSESGKLELKLVRTTDGGPLPLPLVCCSESERARVVWALQSVAGLRAGIVALDSPECLDERFERGPFHLGNWLAEQGVQVILCTVYQGHPYPGWEVIELEDGAVVGSHALEGAAAN